jgi:hypothetical protein
MLCRDALSSYFAGQHPGENQSQDSVDPWKNRITAR